MYTKKTMLGKLILLFIFVPIIELALLIQIGQYLGTLNTILLVIITGITGGILAKLEGWRVLQNIQKDLLEFKMPADRLIDGVLVLIGGILLLTPGILTDILGLSLLIPLTRKFFREMVKKKFAAKVSKGQAHIKVIDPAFRERRD